MPPGWAIPPGPGREENGGVDDGGWFALAIRASNEIVFMLRAVPSAAAAMRSLVTAMPDPGGAGDES